MWTKIYKIRLMDSIPPIRIGKNHIHFAEIHSTNTYLLDLLSKTNPPEGTCVTSDFQSAGRGQIGRSWHSEAGMNFLASFLFTPQNLPVDRQFELSMTIALAVKSLVCQFCSHVSIKWPNDIYVGDRKIAGILIQNNLRGNHIAASVAGIGLNCNQTIFPVHLPNPVSLAQCTGHPFDLEEIRIRCSMALENMYHRWQSGDVQNIQAEYITSLYRYNQYFQYRISTSGIILQAKITDITREGKLVLEEQTGRAYSFDLKEVEYVIQPNTSD